MSNKGSGIASVSWKYIRHFLSSGHRNGYGVHSPFVYDLVRNVIFNHSKMECPKQLLSYHYKQKKNRTVITIEDLGAGSRIDAKKKRTVASIVKNSSVTPKFGQLLYRLSKWYEPQTILEFGTGLGTSTAYLSAGAGDIPFFSIEGSKEKQAFAKCNPYISESSIQCLHGDFNEGFDEMLEKSKNHMLVFIDGDHRYEPTVEKVNAFLKRVGMDEMVIILDDIYWSEGMQDAWEECVSMKEVAISIDLFYLGILIRRPGIEKQHFKINF